MLDEMSTTNLAGLMSVKPDSPGAAPSAPSSFTTNFDPVMPTASGNPPATNPSAPADLLKQNVVIWNNLPPAQQNQSQGPYTGPLDFLSGPATWGSGPAPNGWPTDPAKSIDQNKTYQTPYNPDLFASDDTAQGLAKWLGNGYTVQSKPVITSSPGSPFSFPNANWIVGPDGQVANAGTIANMIQAFGGSPSYLQTLINSAFGPTQTQGPIQS